MFPPVKEKHVQKLLRKSDMAAKKQGYNARLDESLGARNGKKSQSMTARRNESKGAKKAAGKPAYSGNKSSAQRKTTKKK